MSLSRIVAIGDGVTTQFPLSFALGYIKQSDITCQVNGEVDGGGAPVYRALTFISTNLVQVGGAVPGNGVTVVFERTVVNNALLVDFTDGDVLNGENLNTSQKQSIMLVQQVLDGRFATLSTNLDAGNNRITNLGNPVNNQDAVTKAWAIANISPPAGPVTSVNGRGGTVILTKADVAPIFKSDVGLTNVDDTSDINKPVSTAVRAFAREKLSASRTYYVRTTGSDANDGLTNNAGGAFLTLQRALDVLSTLDINNQTVFIQLSDGTYASSGSNLGPLVGTTSPSNVIIQGNVANSSAVILAASGANTNAFGCIGGQATIQFVKVTSSGTSGRGLTCNRGSMNYNNIDFGACLGYHVLGSSLSVINQTDDSKITGDAAYHILMQSGSSWSNTMAITTAATGTRTFTAFVFASTTGIISHFSSTWTGTYVGQRYTASLNGVVNSSGGGANYFPGNSAGSVFTGGQYA
jgi:hypothetical protein